MQEKIAIVTGASRGIGLAIARELAGQGYSLGLVARTFSDLKNTSQDILEDFKGIRVIFDAFDVTDGNCADGFVRRVNDELGNVSVLVNNAGDYRQGTSEMPFGELQQLIDVNFLSAARFVKAVLPAMKKHGSGYIFNIASICGVEAYDDAGGYCASKFALVGYSSSLTQELAPFGINVTAICPSWVNTEKSKDAPLKPEEMIKTDDIAATVRYLLSLGKTASVREIVIHCK